MVSMPLSDTDLAWAAGAIDGEGCIFLGVTMTPKCQHPQFRLAVSVANTDRRMPKKLQEMFGGAVSPINSPKGRRTCYQWTVNASKAGVVLAQVLPYLVIKAEQAALAVQFCDTLARTGGHPPEVRAMRSEIATQLRLLKREAV